MQSASQSNPEWTPVLGSAQSLIARTIIPKSRRLIQGLHAPRGTTVSLRHEYTRSSAHNIYLHSTRGITKSRGAPRCGERPYAPQPAARWSTQRLLLLCVSLGGLGPQRCRCVRHAVAQIGHRADAAGRVPPHAAAALVGGCGASARSHQNQTCSGAVANSSGRQTG
jgi:hypothetical protein